MIRVFIFSFEFLGLETSTKVEFTMKYTKIKVVSILVKRVYLFLVLWLTEKRLTHPWFLCCKLFIMRSNYPGWGLLKITFCSLCHLIYLFIYFSFSSLVHHIGWLLKLYRRADMMERYRADCAWEILLDHFSFAELNLHFCNRRMCSFIFIQVDVWALGVSAIEMAEVCFICLT